MHPDAERLVLLALGDRQGYSAEDAAHAARCAACRAEIEEYRLVGGLVAEGAAEPAREPVAESVWERIAERTGQAGAQLWSGADGTGRAGAVSRIAPPRRGWLRRHGPAALAGAAAGIAATIVVTTAIQEVPEAGSVVATARLAPQAGAPVGAAGTVTVVDEGGGRLVARLAMSGLPAPDGLFELWLFDGSATMIPLGVTRGAAVELPVPAGVALRDYPIVDVSHQHTGQQEHGTSVLQGRLTA